MKVPWVKTKGSKQGRKKRNCRTVPSVAFKTKAGLCYLAYNRPILLLKRIKNTYKTEKQGNTHVCAHLLNGAEKLQKWSKT